MVVMRMCASVGVVVSVFYTSCKSFKKQLYQKAHQHPNTWFEERIYIAMTVMVAQFGMVVNMRFEQVWKQLQKAYGKQKRTAKGGGQLHNVRTYFLLAWYNNAPYHYTHYYEKIAVYKCHFFS